MARKLPRLQRVLDAPALFSIAYGEIASSIYFALGIIALHALGFAPAVLFAAGLLFLIVSLSYAEGTAAIRETGGAATFVRIAFNDFWGFVTGWVLFLDYLIVIALSALFVPHYVAGAFFTKVHRPWDVVIGCCVIAGIAVVALSAFPADHGTLLGSNWLRAPLVGVAAEIRAQVPAYIGYPLQVFVGLSGALILLTAATTSISGFGRLAYSLGEHGQLPRKFGMLRQRTLVSPQSIVAAAVIAIALLVLTAGLTHPVFFLAGLFSFGVLLAFTAAQLAVIKLRFSDPDRRRPYRVPLTVGRVPLPSVVGAVLTFVVWIDALATHTGARYAGPAWLAIGLVVYVAVRRRRGEGLFEPVLSADEHRGLAEAEFSKILVPMKLGEIGEEMIATAVKLAQDRGASVEALHVIRVPLELPLDAELFDQEERAEESIAEAKLLGADHGVTVEGRTVRARAIGQAIVQEASEQGADLIVLGSSPRWRRQSRFFSPTVDYVLKKAPSEVLIVAFPQGVLEGDGDGG